MSTGENGQDRKLQAADDRHGYEHDESEILTPARRAALAALEQEFRDLLAPAR